MLKEMLRAAHETNPYSLDRLDIYFRLAEEFEDNSLALYLSPHELASKLRLGSKQNWEEFLNLEPVRNYIKAQMAHATNIAQRKAFHALQQQAIDGNVQAAKEINELSGVMNQQSNKQVILTRVDRPRTERQQPQPQQEVQPS